MNKIKYLFTGTFFLFFCSCKTYYISIDSFKQQFSEANKLGKKEVTTKGPAGDKVKYSTYAIDIIKCEDDKGNPVELKNGPSIEIRFTDSSNKKTIFYFDLISSVTNQSITGGQSRFISTIEKTIPVNNLKKIEVQDGKKKFRYVN